MLIPTSVKVRICPFSHQAPTSLGFGFRQLAGADVCTPPVLLDVLVSTRGYRATQLFSFQNASQMSKKADLPEAIASWPTLPPDLLAASIQPADSSADPEKQKSDDPKVNSILVVSDDAGHMHCFLDGSYPLGAIVVSAGSMTASLWKDPNNPVFFAHQRSQIGGTTLHPSRVELPLLSVRIPRDLARISTTARELLWYTMRVLDEMHVAWLGSGTQIGAREPGIRWLKSLDDLQAQMGACMHIFPLLIAVALGLTLP
jgi:anaphase-promoting complex subunit 4